MLFSISFERYYALQYSTVQSVQSVQCSTVQCSTVQCSTVQYSTVQYSTVQYSTVYFICALESIHSVHRLRQRARPIPTTSPPHGKVNFQNLHLVMPFPFDIAFAIPITVDLPMMSSRRDSGHYRETE